MLKAVKGHRLCMHCKLARDEGLAAALDNNRPVLRHASSQGSLGSWSSQVYPLSTAVVGVVVLACCAWYIGYVGLDCLRGWIDFVWVVIFILWVGPLTSLVTCHDLQ